MELDFDARVVANVEEFIENFTEFENGFEVVRFNSMVVDVIHGFDFLR